MAETTGSFVHIRLIEQAIRYAETIGGLDLAHRMHRIIHDDASVAMQADMMETDDILVDAEKWDRLIMCIIETQATSDPAYDLGRWTILHSPPQLLRIQLISRGSVALAFSQLGEELRSLIPCISDVIFAQQRAGRCQVLCRGDAVIKHPTLLSYLKGMLAAIPLLFDRREAHVQIADQTQSLLKFRITWQARRQYALYGTLVGGLLAVAWLFLNVCLEEEIGGPLPIWLSACMGMLSLCGIGFYRGKTMELYERWQYDRSRLENQMADINRYYEQLREKNHALQLMKRSLEERIHKSRRRILKKQNELMDANAQLMEVQRQITHSEKLSAVGQLAGGVAHEFNNILAPIQGYTELALTSTRSSESRASLKAILQSCERAKTIVQGLLNFSRRNVPALMMLDMAQLLEGVIHVCRQDFDNRNVEIRTDFQAVPKIVGDPGQLQQVVLDLLLNAAAAMEESMEKVLSIRITHDHGYVVVACQDTGIGMDRATMEKIFEPFYTGSRHRDPSGRRTGLGLSVAQGILQSHHGKIEVRSEPGRGSTFQLFLPIHDAALKRRLHLAGGPKRRHTTALQIPKGLPKDQRPRILVVEDEVLLRDLVSEVLGSAGYRVTAFRTGGDALQVAKEEHFDLALLDVRLPGKSGPDILIGLKTVREDMPVVLMTGSVDEYLDEIVHHLESQAGIALLKKPFKNRDLLRIVTETLKGADQDR